MVAIFDGDVRRATANEQWLLHTPMSVSAGSKHGSINIIMNRTISQVSFNISAINLVYFSGGVAFGHGCIL